MQLRYWGKYFATNKYVPGTLRQYETPPTYDDIRAARSAEAWNEAPFVPENVHEFKSLASGSMAIPTTETTVPK